MRKNRAPKRMVLPDPIYNSRLVTKAINAVMLDGKKGLAQNLLYGSFDLIEKKINEKGIDVYKKALENIIPQIELRVRRIAGANFQVPTPVSKERRIPLALRWVILYSRTRNEKTMVERLAAEIIDASKGMGSSVKKRDDTHKMAEANKAFAHLRF